MNNLVVPDQFQSLYDFQESIDPSFNYHLVQMKKADVKAVDYLLEQVGFRNAVTTHEDWQALEKVLSFYWKQWPEDAKQFKDAIPGIRSSKGAGGYSQSRETRHVGSIPDRLMRLIKIVFPDQQWDKEFSNKFVRRYKIFDVGGQTNLSSGKVIL